MNIYTLTPAHILAADEHKHDHDWCPRGGTSLRRYHELARQYDAAFRQEFTRRVADHAELWVKDLGRAIHAGWRDDPNGDYYIGHGLEHLHHVPETQLRSFCFLGYTSEAVPESDSLARYDPSFGTYYFEPPYTHDTVLHVDYVMAWIAAHHRTW